MSKDEMILYCKNEVVISKIKYDLLDEDNNVVVGGLRRFNSINLIDKDTLEITLKIKVTLDGNEVYEVRNEHGT